MEFFEAVKKRYSYRGQYRPVPVPRGDLQKILEAGLAAPSGCNTQTTSCIALDDPELIRSVGGLIKSSAVTAAPAAICVLTQHKAVYKGMCFNVQDYAAAIENMLLAVTALGYAGCWIEGEVAEDPKIPAEIARILGIPGEYSVVAYLPVGRPVGEGRRPPYKPFEERAWFNGFGKN
jgi:nitroreductase